MQIGESRSDILNSEKGPEVVLSYMQSGNITSDYANLTSEQILSKLGTSVETGLSIEQVTKRLNLYGLNELSSTKDEPWYAKFADQLKNPLILLLFGSAGVSLLIGRIDDALSITLAVLIVATVAYVQESRSEKSLKSLAKLVPYQCRALRSGQWHPLGASELVPGDIVEFSLGDRVPADVRLLFSEAIEIDESLLTGETKLVKKHSNALSGSSIPLTECANTAFMGTLVRGGNGVGVVTATGANTEFGHVFQLVQGVETGKTTLQIKMEVLGKQLTLMSFGVIFIIAVIGLWRGRSLLDMMTIGVSLAVAAIPEGLPIAVTVTLALGVLRMAQEQCIVKKLPTVESLGSVSVICLDKTGTLTMNKMTLVQACFFEHRTLATQSLQGSHVANPGISRLLQAAVLCSNAKYDIHGHIMGQPTETALLDGLQQINAPDLRTACARISELPFDSEKKFMTVNCQYTAELESIFPLPSSLSAVVSKDGVTVTKGAPDILLEKCAFFIEANGALHPLTNDLKQDTEAALKKSNCEGLRVLVIAYGAGIDSLVLVGLVCMHDPPRPGVGAVIELLQKEQIRLVMITGDAKDTACAIAGRLNFPVTTQLAISGSDIDAADSSRPLSLSDALRNVCVVYRATPKHKMKIVKAWQEAGHVVAMTGDGVNDAPALKLADIGVAMGLNGTDVAKEAADVILVDDQMSTIMRAVEEGKYIFHNIQNFLCFQLSTSMASLLLIAITTFLGWASPLNPMQILWINIICDGPVAQSLGVENVDGAEVRKQPPRRKDSPILTLGLFAQLLQSSAIILVGTFYVLKISITSSSSLLEEDDSRCTTMTFTAFVLFDLFNSLCCRSRRHSVFFSVPPGSDRYEFSVFTHLLSNKFWLGAVAFVFFGQWAVVSVPFLQSVFQTEALSAADWLFLIVLASSILWIHELSMLGWFLHSNSRNIWRWFAVRASKRSILLPAVYNNPKEDLSPHSMAHSPPAGQIGLTTMSNSWLLQDQRMPSPNLGPSAVLVSQNRSRPASANSSGLSNTNPTVLANVDHSPFSVSVQQQQHSTIPSPLAFDLQRETPPQLQLSSTALKSGAGTLKDGTSQMRYPPSSPLLFESVSPSIASPLQKKMAKNFGPSAYPTYPIFSNPVKKAN